MKLTRSKCLLTRKGELMEFWVKCCRSKLDLITISNGWQEFNVFIEDWERAETMRDLVNCHVSKRVILFRGKRHISYMRLCEYMQYLKLHEPTFYELVTTKEVNQDA